VYKTTTNNSLYNLFVISVSVFLFAVAASTQADPLDINDQTPTFECLIQPDMEIHVSSPIKGVFDEIFVDNSDFVKKGQILAQLESGVQKAVVAMAKARAHRQDEIRAHV